MNRICPIMGLLLLFANVSASAETQTTAATNTADKTTSTYSLQHYRSILIQCQQQLLKDPDKVLNCTNTDTSLICKNTELDKCLHFKTEEGILTVRCPEFTSEENISTNLKAERELARQQADKKIRQALNQCISEKAPDLAQPKAGSTKVQTVSALSKTWLSTFELGYKRQNDYDDEGNRTFNKNSYIASLSVNGRWNYNDGFLPDDWYFSWLPDDLLHLETGVIFSEAPSAEEKTSIKPTTFNTVTHSVDAYTDLTLGKNMDNYATLNIGLKLGLRTLDNAVSSDELARYWGPGVEFNVYSQDIREGRNTRPRGSLKAYWTRFSDYGTRSGQNVWLIQARFKLAEDKPYIISLDAELDKNERDNYSVSFIVRQDTDELLKFFGF